MRPAVFLRSGLVLAAGTLVILMPALVNGYPFVFADTGTYIRSAFTGYVPYDRPYWYGPFIRATSLGGFSLWGVAVAQALLCAWCIRRVCALGMPQHPIRAFLAACLLLAVGSGLGWYAAQLTPDVFTGIGLLAVFTLVRDRKARWLRVVDVALIVAACWYHTSNLLILPLAGAALLVIGRRDGAALLRPGAIALVAATALAWGGLALANRAADGEAYISRNSHVFLMGRMLDTGMLGPYLDEHCAQEHFGICAYRDSLPANSFAFLWSDRSPVARQGGWDATREEYTRIVHGSFRQPKYLWWHMRGSFLSTAEQLGAWRICQHLESRWYRTDTSPPYWEIRDHVPHELPRYLGSLQNGGRGELGMRWPDLVYRLVLAAALFAVLWRLLFRGASPEPGEAVRFGWYALVAIVIGAGVCASLSVVDSRYLGRDSWLLPLAALFLLMPRPAEASH